MLELFSDSLVFFRSVSFRFLLSFPPSVFSFFSAFNVLLFKMQCYARIKFDYELKQSLHVSNYKRIYVQEVEFFEKTIYFSAFSVNLF